MFKLLNWILLYMDFVITDTFICHHLKETHDILKSVSEMITQLSVNPVSSCTSKRRGN